MSTVISWKSSCHGLQKRKKKKKSTATLQPLLASPIPVSSTHRQVEDRFQTIKIQWWSLSVFYHAWMVMFHLLSPVLQLLHSQTHPWFFWMLSSSTINWRWCRRQVFNSHPSTATTQSFPSEQLWPCVLLRLQPLCQSTHTPSSPQVCRVKVQLRANFTVTCCCDHSQWAVITTTINKFDFT